MTTSNNVLLNSIGAMLGNKEAARANVISQLSQEAFYMLRDGNSHHVQETVSALATAKGNGKVLHGFFAAFIGDVAAKRNKQYKQLTKAAMTSAQEVTIKAFINKGITAMFKGFDNALNEKKAKASATREANKAAKGTDTTASDSEASAKETPAATPITQASINSAKLPKGWNAVTNKAGTVTGFLIGGFEVSIKSMEEHAAVMNAAMVKVAELTQKAA